MRLIILLQIEASLSVLWFAMYFMMRMKESTNITPVVNIPISRTDIIKSTNGPKSSITAANSAYIAIERVKIPRLIRKNSFSNLLNFIVFSSIVHLLHFKYTPFSLKFKIKRPIKFYRSFFVIISNMIGFFSTLCAHSLNAVRTSS